MVRDQPVDNELLNMMKAKGVWMVSATLSREMAYSLAIMPWLQRSVLHPRRHAGHLGLRCAARRAKRRW